MSLDIAVYTRHLSDDLIPKIQKRLNDFEMTCEIHPKFSFSDQTGFLPFKFQLTNPPFEKLRDKVLMSGFELYIDDFDFEQEKKKIQPKPSFMDKLTGKKIADRPLVNDEVDQRLKVTQEGLLDDSVAGEKRIFEFKYINNTWTIASLKLGFKCYESRGGHTNYSGGMCP